MILHAVGFAIAPDVTTRAVRSYRTFSPLPVSARDGPSAVSFLLHFPSPPAGGAGGCCPPPCPFVFGLSSDRSKPGSGRLPARTTVYAR